MKKANLQFDGRLDKLTRVRISLLNWYGSYRLCESVSKVGPMPKDGKGFPEMEVTETVIESGHYDQLVKVFGYMVEDRKAEILDNRLFGGLI